ncbi:uncharacterized protein CBL_10914 [Carabus blaptoides fortunei]
MHWIVNLDGGPRRVNHAAAAVAIAYEKKIYIWGGRNDEMACNTLFVFDTTTNCWDAPEVGGYKPPARDGHSACVMDNRMYIFGGFEEETETFSQEVHEFSFQSMRWLWYYTIGIPPSLRDFHSAAVIDYVPWLGGTMFIFGGRGDRGYSPNNRHEEIYSQHIQCLNIYTHLWSTPFTYGDIPIGRRSHSAFVHKQFMYIFGGYNGNMDRHFNDLYRYDPIKQVWNLINTIGKRPCERRRQSCIVVGDRMYLFGGTSPSDNPRRRRNSSNSDSDNYEDTSDLMDHNDLYVLDLNPTLRSLTMLAVIENKLDYTCLPASLQFEIRMMTTPNNITKPLEEVEEELSDT